MKNLLNKRIILLAAAICLVCSGLTNAQQGTDLYSISAGTIKDPAIVSSMRIPVVGKEVTLSARIRGPGIHPVDVDFILEADDITNVTLPAKKAAVQDGGDKYVDYEAVWKPAKTGMYNFTVKVDPDKKSGDNVTANNVASVVLPVVWREIDLIPWGPQPYCKWVGTSVPVGMKGVGRQKVESDLADDIAYWKRRGSAVLGFMRHSLEQQRYPTEIPAEEWIGEIVGKADFYAAAGCDGLIIDESSIYHNESGLEYLRRFEIAYGKILQKHPQLRVYNWISGSIFSEETELAVRKGYVLIGESYEPHHAPYAPTFDRFLDLRVKRLMKAPGSIIALGTGRDCGRVYKPQLENNVRLCRILGPDLPGIQYYVINPMEEGAPYQGSLQEFFDGISMKYFIKPVLMISDEDIDFSVPAAASKKDITLKIKIRNIGGMTAKNVTAEFYAREIDSNKRSLIASVDIAEIGNGKLDRQIADVLWKPKKAGHYRIEIQLQPSENYTTLQGFAQKVIPVTQKALSPVRQEYSKSIVTVTENDVWLSNYTPAAGEQVDVQVRVHNIGKTEANDVGVKVYVRNIADNKRSMLMNTVIGKIRTDIVKTENEILASIDHKIVDGTKYPVVVYSWKEKKNIQTFFNRALIDTNWTPKKNGYYSLEVELQPSENYKIRNSHGEMMVLVVD